MTTAYLPSINWWRNWLNEEMPEIDVNAPFDKHLAMNWCNIDAPNGELRLTVPIQKLENKRQPVKDIKISSHGDWQHKHWHALQSSYYNSPFFEYYQDDFEPLYTRDYTFLVDFNHDLIEVCKNLMNIDSDSIKHRLSNNTTDFKTYYQVFDRKHGFLPNLSIFDLIMNMGPESPLYI